MRLKTGAVLERSLANGPGERFVIWTQGCALACPGCFNTHLWPGGGKALSTRSLARRANSEAGLRGVTLTGGEPLEQPEAVLELLGLLDPRLDTVVFTGFTPAEIEADPRKAGILKAADLIVAGRYEREKASEANLWAGSSNKVVLPLTGRIRADEFPSCRVEAILAPDGSVTITGFPSKDLLKL